jgi:hypothetical protein
MDWLISLEQFEWLALSRPSPPYFMLVAGLLISITCIIPLAIGVRQWLTYWLQNSSTNSLPAGGRLQVVVPFSGTLGGFYIFFASGLEVFGLPVLPSLFLSLLATALLGYLAWLQLGRMLSRRAVRSYINRSSDFPPAQKSSLGQRTG